MRFLADENIPGRLVAALRALGQDVRWIRADAPGADDQAVLALATVEFRVLVTFDKDFGELAGRSTLPKETGVILLRVALDPTPEAARQLAGIIVGRSDWPGHFTVVEPGRVRLRPLIRFTRS